MRAGRKYSEVERMFFLIRQLDQDKGPWAFKQIFAPYGALYEIGVNTCKQLLDKLVASGALEYRTDYPRKRGLYYKTKEFPRQYKRVQELIDLYHDNIIEKTNE